MNISSKISRSLVVIIFAVNVIFLGFIDLRLLTGKTKIDSDYSNLFKLGYVALVVILVLIYVYIKDKLYKKKIKRSIGLVYRYIYIVIVLIASKLLILYFSDFNFTLIYNVSYMALSCAIGIVIRKIVFNVSKSDMLSVFATFSYILLPVAGQSSSKIMISLVYTLAIFSAILALQILVDELKQRGIKTKKYIVEATVLGAFIGINMVLGVSPFVWVAFGVISIFIASNLDSTHINFPKKMMSNITQQKREALYKIERININKIFVSICIIFIASSAMYFMASFVLEYIAEPNTGNYYMQVIAENLDVNAQWSSIKNISISGLEEFYTSVISHSKTYYLALICYIIFMEILAVALRRRYDTKSTMMKALFILIVNSVYILKFDLELYNQMINVLFILIAIVNTSNIYLNREERIKMLVA